MDICSASNSVDISCQQVVEKSFNSWSGLLLMMFTTLLVIAAGFALYKWRNRGVQQLDDGEVDETSDSHAARVARYNGCSLSEASDPDLWMQTRHFQGEPLDHDESDEPENHVGFEDWSMNQEVALLMVMQKIFNEMRGLGRITSWRVMWQLKQLLKVGVIGETRGLLYSGLKSLHGDYTGYLGDDTYRAVYEPRMTYQEDMADLTRCLTRHYFASHGFDGETLYRELLGFLRDLDFETLEEAQLQIDRDNDPSTRLLENMQRARECAINTLHDQLKLALENNDMDRYHQLERSNLLISTLYDVLVVLTILAYFIREVSRCGEGKTPGFLFTVICRCYAIWYL